MCVVILIAGVVDGGLIKGISRGMIGKGSCELWLQVTYSIPCVGHVLYCPSR